MNGGGDNVGQVAIINEVFQNDLTGEEVHGLTVMVDGQVKEIFDHLLSIDPTYTRYDEVMRDVLFEGLKQLLQGRT